MPSVASVALPRTMIACDSPVPHEREPALSFQPHWFNELRSGIVGDVCRMQSVEFRNMEKILQALLDQISNRRGSSVLGLELDDRESFELDSCQFKAAISRAHAHSTISHNHVPVAPMSVGLEVDPFKQSSETIKQEVKELRPSRETEQVNDKRSSTYQQFNFDKQDHEWKDAVHAFLGVHARNAESQKRASYRHRTMRWLGIAQRHKIPPNTKLSRWVSGSQFSTAVVILVLCNVCWIGYESERTISDAINDRFGLDAYADIQKGVYPKHTNARSVLEEKNVALSSISVTFASLFAFELIIKVVALRGSFFFGEGWGMNMLDLAMVLSTALEVLVGANLRQARLLRAFRMARVLRIIRMIGAFRQLRQIVCSIYSSITVLGWSLVMMYFIMYMFSLLFMQVSATHLGDANINDPNAHRLAEHFGSTTDSIQTLLRSITGGEDWGIVANALEKVHPIWSYVFSIYIFIMIFGVMNILIGVFCEAASECSALDQDLIVHRERLNKDHILETLSCMFSQIDRDDDGVITWEQFRAHAQEEECFNFFMAKGVNLMDANALFQVLDESSEDEAGKVDQNSFLIVMMRMIGHAKSTDLMMLLHESRKHLRKIKETLKAHRVILDNLQANQQASSNRDQVQSPDVRPRPSEKMPSRPTNISSV